MPARGDGGQGKYGLGEREPFTYADAGARAERQVGASRPAAVGGQTPVGVEGAGVGIDVRPVVDEVRADKNGCTRGQRMAAQPGVGGDRAAEQASGRVEPERLGDDPPGQLEAGQVLPGGVRPSSTVSISAWSRSRMAGLRASRCSAQASAVARVSDPARKNEMT